MSIKRVQISENTSLVWGELIQPPVLHAYSLAVLHIPHIQLCCLQVISQPHTGEFECLDANMEWVADDMHVAIAISSPIGTFTVRITGMTMKGGTVSPMCFSWQQPTVLGAGTICCTSIRDAPISWSSAYACKTWRVHDGHQPATCTQAARAMTALGLLPCISTVWKTI